jgi:hypothetical protein
MSWFEFFIYGLALVTCIHTPSLTIGILSGSLIDKALTYLLISYSCWNDREIDYISSIVSGEFGFWLWQFYVKGFTTFNLIVSGISVFVFTLLFPLINFT